MGSWNESDLLTQLPIEYHDKIRLLILSNQQLNVYSETDINYGKLKINGGGSTSIHDIWSPILPPLKGIYGDYGVIEKIKPSVEKEMLHDFFKKSFVFSDPEEFSRVEDYNSKSKTQSLAVYLRAVERGYGCWKNIMNQVRPLGFVMILEDVYQVAMKYNPIVMDSDWTDHKNPIHLYRPWQDSIQLRIENWYKKSFETYQKLNSSNSEEERIDFSANLLISNMENNLFDHRSACAIQFSRSLTSKAKSGIVIEDPSVKNIINAFKEIILLDGFMNVTRKFYSPQTGKGSQDNELHPYLLLNKCINNISETRNKIYLKENIVDKNDEPDENGYTKYMLDFNKKQLEKVSKENAC